MLTLNSPKAVQEKVLPWKGKHKIAFVATMGCLHEGHIALIQRARHFADRIIVSIFVNPMQFGPNEDFAKYPRTIAEDAERLEGAKGGSAFHARSEGHLSRWFFDPSPCGRALESAVRKITAGAFRRSGHGVPEVLSDYFGRYRDIRRKRFSAAARDPENDRRFEFTGDHHLAPDRPRNRWLGALFAKSLSLRRRKKTGGINPAGNPVCPRPLASHPEATVGDLVTAARKYIEGAGL